MILHLKCKQLFLPGDDIHFVFRVMIINAIGDRVTFCNKLIDDADFLLIAVFGALSMIDGILEDVHFH